jgi:uncharacterized protein
MKHAQYSALLITLLLCADSGLAQESTGAPKTSGEKELLAEGLASYNRGDLITAMAHYRKAASSGSLEAKVRLAWILDQSEDNAGALQLYTEAAEAGYAAGQHGLAEMYANGEGVRRDVRRAVKLFKAAADAGYLRSMEVLAAAYREGGLGLKPSLEQAAYWTAKQESSKPVEQDKREP